MVIRTKLLDLFGISGIMLFPFLIVKKDSSINHERIHFRQCISLGVIPFYIWYFIEYLILLPKYRGKAYYFISFEQDAYLNDWNTNYKSYYGWTKYVFKKHPFKFKQ